MQICKSRRCPQAITTPWPNNWISLTHLHNAPPKSEDSIANFNKGNDRCCIGSRRHYHSCSTNEEKLAMRSPYIRILYYYIIRILGEIRKIFSATLFWIGEALRIFVTFDDLILVFFSSGSSGRKFSYKFFVYCQCLYCNRWNN